MDAQRSQRTRRVEAHGLLQRHAVLTFLAVIVGFLLLAFSGRAVLQSIGAILLLLGVFAPAIGYRFQYGQRANEPLGGDHMNLTSSEFEEPEAGLAFGSGAPLSQQHPERRDEELRELLRRLDQLEHQSNDLRDEITSIRKLIDDLLQGETEAHE